MLPCIQGWMAHMKYRVVPALAVTFWVTWVPDLVSPVNQESPVVPVVLPSVLQPGAPALTRVSPTFSVFGLKCCHSAIERQMCFGVKQLLRAAGVFGSEPLV